MDTAVLAQMELFSGLDQEEIGRVLACLNAHTRSYQRGEVICPMGQPTDYIGLVLKGTILVEYQDAWGKRSLLTPVGTGKTFSEVFAFIPDESLPVSVVANPHASAVGGALLAGHGAGLYPDPRGVAFSNLPPARQVFSHPRAAAAYSPLFERYQRLYAAVRPLYEHP